MKTIGDTKVRDQVALTISSDLEKVRNTVNLWQIDSSNLNSDGLPKNGEISYQPSATMCSDNTLAVDLLTDGMGDEGSLTESTDTAKRVKSITVAGTGMALTRTVSSDASNQNLLKVHYAVDSNVLQHSDQSTTLMMPAQAWCP